VSDNGSTRHGMRVIRVPRAAALLLAIPVLLALGVASIVVFFVAIAAVFCAPLLRSNGHKAHESPPENGTITLDRTAYRTVEGDVPDAERRRPPMSVTRALPPGRPTRD
jgi:hypothetical protein